MDGDGSDDGPPSSPEISSGRPDKRRRLKKMNLNRRRTSRPLVVASVPRVSIPAHAVGTRGKKKPPPNENADEDSTSDRISKRGVTAAIAATTKAPMATAMDVSDGSSDESDPTDIFVAEEHGSKSMAPPLEPGNDQKNDECPWMKLSCVIKSLASDTPSIHSVPRLRKRSIQSLLASLDGEPAQMGNRNTQGHEAACNWFNTSVIQCTKELVSMADTISVSWLLGKRAVDLLEVQHTYDTGDPMEPVSAISSQFHHYCDVVKSVKRLTGVSSSGIIRGVFESLSKGSNELGTLLPFLSFVLHHTGTIPLRDMLCGLDVHTESAALKGTTRDGTDRVVGNGKPASHSKDNAASIADCLGFGLVLMAGKDVPAIDTKKSAVRYATLNIPPHKLRSHPLSSNEVETVTHMAAEILHAHYDGTAVGAQKATAQSLLKAFQQTPMAVTLPIMISVAKALALRVSKKSRSAIIHDTFVFEILNRIMSSSIVEEFAPAKDSERNACSARDTIESIQAVGSMITLESFLRYFLDGIGSFPTSTANHAIRYILKSPSMTKELRVQTKTKLNALFCAALESENATQLVHISWIFQEYFNAASSVEGQQETYFNWFVESIVLSYESLHSMDSANGGQSRGILTSKHQLLFLLTIFETMVPRQPVATLRIHVQQCNRMMLLPNSFCKDRLKEYISLVKTRIADLASDTDPSFIFSEQVQQDLTKFVEASITAGGGLPKSLLELSVWHKRYWRDELLPALLGSQSPLGWTDKMKSQRYVIVELLIDAKRVPVALVKKYQHLKKHQFIQDNDPQTIPAQDNAASQNAAGSKRRNTDVSEGNITATELNFNTAFESKLTSLLQENASTPSLNIDKWHNIRQLLLKYLNFDSEGEPKNLKQVVFRALNACLLAYKKGAGISFDTAVAVVDEFLKNENGLNNNQSLLIEYCKSLTSIDRITAVRPILCKFPAATFFYGSKSVDTLTTNFNELTNIMILHHDCSGTASCEEFILGLALTSYLLVGLISGANCMDDVKDNIMGQVLGKVDWIFMASLLAANRDSLLHLPGLGQARGSIRVARTWVGNLFLKSVTFEVLDESLKSSHIAIGRALFSYLCTGPPANILSIVQKGFLFANLQRGVDSAHRTFFETVSVVLLDCIVAKLESLVAFDGAHIQANESPTRTTVLLEAAQIIISVMPQAIFIFNDKALETASFLSSIHEHRSIGFEDSCSTSIKAFLYYEILKLCSPSCHARLSSLGLVAIEIALDLLLSAIQSQCDNTNKNVSDFMTVSSLNDFLRVVQKMIENADLDSRTTSIRITRLNLALLQEISPKLYSQITSLPTTVQSKRSQDDGMLQVSTWLSHEAIDSLHKALRGLEAVD